ncbi:hypothetical protein JTE90_025475 [Oedothorax gibbosus]|uniref:Uncharacterized protein n=1 Tax=Oedothorax gibbosus TaxID=931172 RepID=A0AAV6UX57_9ARAC|nr:hypothetical protein JTE90_025475 [Oedothorax gibbosus]
MVDDLLSFPLLISTIYASGVMYLTLNVLLHPDIFPPEFHMYASFYSLFIITFVLFVAMTVAASRVADAASEIGRKAWSLKDNRYNTTYVKQRFLMCTQKEVNLTVWKLVPVKRSFPIGVIGGIFTYIALFYSLDNSFQKVKSLDNSYDVQIN